METYPISVSDRLPESNTPQGDAFVLAYDREMEWVPAVYHPERGWEIDAIGVSGYEWETERIVQVTHWMPWPPKPE